MATKAQEPQDPQILSESALDFPFPPQRYFSISTAKNKERTKNVKENQTDENEEHGACNVVSSKSRIIIKIIKKKKTEEKMYRLRVT